MSDAGAWGRDHSATELIDNSIADQDFDAEVARFLVTAFFASADDDDSAAVVPPIQSTADELGRQLVNEDILFMDFMESFDMPDLELGNVVSKPSSERFEVEGEALSSSTLPAAVVVATTDSREFTGSLQVLISTSALGATASQTAHQRNMNPPSKPELQPPPALKKPRKRVKDELEYLRQQVKDFEEKLEQLNQSSCEGLSSGIGWSTNSISRLQSGSWEGVAKRQQLEKEKSTIENVAIKETLGNQLQLAQSLSKLLETQQDLSWLDSPSAGRAAKKLCISSNNTDESVFSALTAQVEMMYSEVDAALSVFRRVGPEPGVKSDANGNVFIEFVDSSVLPFEFRTTASAMWKLVSASSINLGSRQYQAISATDETARARLSMTLRLRRQDSLIEMSYVGKRYIETDRVVIVWCTMSDAQGGHLLVNENERVRVRECGWSVMAAANTATAIASGGLSPQGTFMQTITRMTPELDRSGAAVSEALGHHVGLLTDVVLALNHQNLVALRQMIENVILSDAVEGSSR